MELSRVHHLMMFTLGSWYNQAGKKLEGRPLELAITKSVFIQALMKAGIAGKKERALYHNLEMLGRKKLIDYKGKCLTLTKRGIRQFNIIDRQVSPYMKVLDVLHQKDPLQYTRHAQTRFSTANI